MKGIAKQFGAFLAVGGVSGCILLATNFVLRELLSLPPNIAYPCGFLPVIITNFVMMRKVVMPSADPRWGRQLLAFVASTIVWRGLESVFGLFLFDAVKLTDATKWLYYVLVVGNAGLFTVLKFVYYRLTVFKPRRVATDEA